MPRFLYLPRPRRPIVFATPFHHAPGPHGTQNQFSVNPVVCTISRHFATSSFR